MQSKLPIIAVNGVIGAQVSPLDRGFTYGDGVFETCRLTNAKIPLWTFHKERLFSSCEKLGIKVAIDNVEAQIKSLISTANIADAVIKIIVTRGEGGRGYKADNTVRPTLVVGVFPAAEYPRENSDEGVRIKICAQRLGQNTGLAGLKHLNRLEQILARSEWDDQSIAEGVMLDTGNNIIEAIFSNIFLVKNGVLLTPELHQAGVAGIMRKLIMEQIAPQIAISLNICQLKLEDLVAADEVFLCNSLYGIWPVRELLGEQLHQFQVGEITKHLQQHLVQTLNELSV